MKKVTMFLLNNLIIVKLDLCYNEVGDVGIQTLVEEYFINNDNTLLHLNLGNCNLGPKAIESLLSTASTLKLKTLRLNGNKLGFEVTSKLASLSNIKDMLFLGRTTCIRIN